MVWFFFSQFDFPILIKNNLKRNVCTWPSITGTNDQTARMRSDVCSKDRIVNYCK